MDLELSGRRALVFGATAGLGRAVAATLTAEGARVAISGRSSDRAHALVVDGIAQHAAVGDLAVAGTGARIVAEAAEALGGLDICVVNTGGGTPGGILATNGADQAAYNSMLAPALEIARAAAPLLADRADDGDAGRLVFLTARSILEASPELALSSVMRSGVAAAARSLALELAPDVLVNVVATGQFETGALLRFEEARAAMEACTPQEVRAKHTAAIPLGRIGQPEELADAVAFLCSRRASFITGTVVRVDGGAVAGF